VDLVADLHVEELAGALIASEGRVDVLVHCAGTISRGNHETAPIDDLDQQYAINVRAPYLLTQILLPALSAAEGQIVFINSTAGLHARAGSGQFAATQHALTAIADSLREEINPHGVRVISVYPGRTATPRQARIYAQEARPYSPERLVQPGDVASIVMESLTLPRSAELTDVTVRSRLKP
jgi:NADP-dependent 3-hydroxy acid dehydrogenase YdfG